MAQVLALEDPKSQAFLDANSTHPDIPVNWGLRNLKRV